MRAAALALAIMAASGLAWADDGPPPTRAEQLAGQLAMTLMRANAQIDELERQVATLREQVAGLTKAMRAQLGSQQQSQQPKQEGH